MGIKLVSPIFYPPDFMSVDCICARDAPIVQSGQKLRLMSWNVQFMAGKEYLFFFDLMDFSGPDERPAAASISKTLDGIAAVITEEKPDIVLLQEVDDGAQRTDYEDQADRLVKLLGSEYCCRTEAFYWKSGFVPHPRIMGSVGMKLVILSRYRITAAYRHQLPRFEVPCYERLFQTQRAVLEVHFPVAGGRDLVVMNTHLDAFAQGTDNIERQVLAVRNLCDRLTDEGFSWILGGDFNLLPPGPAFARLPEEQRIYFNEKSELQLLTERYSVIPSVNDCQAGTESRWFTHFPNDPSVMEPDRTIDYLFYSPNVLCSDYSVRQNGTMSLSDHFPLVAEFLIKN